MLCSTDWKFALDTGCMLAKICAINRDVKYAMVSKCVLGRAIVNFFLKLNNKGREEYPNKVFSTEEEALQWIREINVF